MRCPTYADEERDDCAICLRRLTERRRMGRLGRVDLREPLSTLVCGHVFHLSCLGRLRGHMCPLCRMNTHGTKVCDLLCFDPEEAADREYDGEEYMGSGIILSTPSVSDIEVIGANELVIAEDVQEIVLRLDNDQVRVVSPREGGGFTRGDVVTAAFEVWGGQEDTIMHTLERLGNGTYRILYDT